MMSYRAHFQNLTTLTKTPIGSDNDDTEAENNVVGFESDVDDDISSEWNDNFNIPNINSNIVFNPHDNYAGINPDIMDTMNSLSPYGFFTLFFDDEVINLIIVETNRYAHSNARRVQLV